MLSRRDSKSVTLVVYRIISSNAWKQTKISHSVKTESQENVKSAINKHLVVIFLIVNFAQINLMDTGCTLNVYNAFRGEDVQGVLSTFSLRLGSRGKRNVLVSLEY